MNKILLTAFAGVTNSSKILIDSICVSNTKKIILANSFDSCGEQVVEAIKTLKPDTILSFGQKPKTDILYIETQAKRNEHTLQTTIDTKVFAQTLAEKNIEHIISNNAGSYLCNHVYYEGLGYINQSELETKMVFVHIPSIKNIKDLARLKDWVEYLCHQSS